MKRKTSLFLLALMCAILCAFGLTACDFGDKPSDGHTHEYSQTWSYDNAQHWHKCVGCDVKKDVANHSFKNGVCKVCGCIEGSSGISVAGKSFVFNRVEVSYDNEEMAEYATQIKAQAEEQMKNDYISFSAGGTCSVVSNGNTVNGTYTQNGNKVSMTVGGQVGEITVMENSISVVTEMSNITLTAIYVKGTPSKPTTPDNPNVPAEPSLCKHEDLYFVEDYKDADCKEEGYELNVAVCRNIINGNVCGTVLDSRVEGGSELGKLNIGSEYEFKNLIESGEIKNYLDEYRTVIDKTDHTPVIDDAVPATCSTKGLSEGSHCGVCNEVLKAQIETDFTDHSYSDTIEYTDALRRTDNVCSGCGLLKNKGYIFKTKLNEDEQSYTLIKGDGWTELSFESLRYNGKPITIIYGGDCGGAFRDCKSLTRVGLSGVMEIWTDAFTGCTNLVSVHFGDDLKLIANFAFQQCAFKSVKIPNSVKTIGRAVFYKCDNLESITIPFVGVGEWNEEHCTGEGLTSYFVYIFGFNNNIPASLKSVTVTDAERIGSYAFDSCRNIQNVTIADSVTNIGTSAFSGCTELTSINLPDSVTWIGSDAFNNCSSLTSITFNGTKAQWKAISKGSAWNDNTGNYTVHCTDGKLDKSGNELE